MPETNVPETTVKDSQYYRHLDGILAAARQAYDNRKIDSVDKLVEKIYNFVKRSDSDGQPVEEIINVSDDNLSTSDLLRKIQYIETRLTDLVRIEQENRVAVEHKVAMETCYNHIANELPIEMQPLKVLYSLGKLDIVEDFLKANYQFVENDNQSLLNYLIQDLNTACDEECRAEAQKQLKKRISDYDKLSKQRRDALEEQYAYLIMLRAYAQFSGDNSAESQALRKRVEQDAILAEQNINKVLAEQTAIKDAVEEFNIIKQELSEIDSEQRWKNRTAKTLATIKAIYTYPLSMPSGKKTKSALSNIGKGVALGAISVIGYYLGIDTLASTISLLATSTAVGAAAVPVGAFLKADIEANRARFPELEHDLEFLERTDLNQVDKVFLLQIDSDMEYDPVTHQFVDPQREGLLVENDNLFKDIYKDALAKVEKYIAALTQEVKNFAEENVLKDVNLTRTFIEDVLIAAGKTVAGLIFVAGGTLLAFLLAVGLTGPIVLFAMSPALSIGLLGGAVVAGLKYMYPDPQRTTMGFMVDAAVNIIFAPISMIVAGTAMISRPFVWIYNACNKVTQAIKQKIQAVKIEHKLVVLDLPEESKLTVDFAEVHKADPELLSMLICHFKIEQGIIRDKIHAAVSGKSDVALKQASNDLTFLEASWGVFKHKGNEPLAFAKMAEVFLQERYPMMREHYEAAAKQRAIADQNQKPYVEMLSFSKRPDFVMPNVIDYDVAQKELRNMQCLKEHAQLLIKPQ